MAETLRLTVTGMTCGGCENAVKLALGRLKGVQTVQASHEASSVEVTFDDTQVSSDVLRTAIEGLGYHVAP